MKADIVKFARDWGAILGIAVAAVTLHQSLTDSIKDLRTEIKSDIRLLETELKADIRLLETELKADIGLLETELKADIRLLDDKIFRLGSEIRASRRNTSFAEGSSPITLTPEGQVVAKRIGAKAIAEKYADRVEIPDNATRLEIHNASFEFALYQMEFLVNQQEKELIDEAIFEEDASNPGTVYSIFGVLIRDYHLEKRGLEVPKRKG